MIILTYHFTLSLKYFTKLKNIYIMREYFNLEVKNNLQILFSASLKNEYCPSPERAVCYTGKGNSISSWDMRSREEPSAQITK